MNRRDAIQHFTLMMGGTFALNALPIIPDYWEFDESSPLSFFSKQQRKLVAELTEVIIPTTDTPGAKAAKVVDYIELMLQDCYKKEEQNTFIEGLLDVEKRAKATFQKSFTKLKPQEQTEIVATVEQAAKDMKSSMRVANGKYPKSFFDMLRSLTVTGYFTSEVGAQQALAYLPVPGPYQGCVPLAAGQKTWALN
jgi:hypothetical protein